MKKLILFILFAATTISIPPQTTTSTTTPLDSSFEHKVEVLMNDINTDLTKAAEEKEALEKKLQMNKLMFAEKNRRIDQILKKINRTKSPQPETKGTVKTVVKIVPEKQRYAVKKDSACLRKDLFSSKCNKWDTYYILIDSKNKDTLVLKRH